MMGRFFRFFPTILVGGFKDIPRHCAALFSALDDTDKTPPTLKAIRKNQRCFFKELELYEISLDYMSMCFEMTSILSMQIPNMVRRLQVPALPSNMFTFESPSEDDDEALPRKDRDLDGFYDAFNSINFQQNIEHCKYNECKHKDSNFRIFQLNWFPIYDETCSQTEGCHKGQRDLPFKDLVYKSSADSQLQVKECFSIFGSNWSGNFEKDVHRIAKAGENFARDLGQKLVKLTDYLLKATADGRLLDVLVQAAKDVALVVKKILAAIGELVNRVLNVLNLIDGDAQSKAIQVAQTCADCTQTTAKKFFTEAKTLNAVGTEIAKAAGTEISSDASKAVSQLYGMASSVQNYAKNLQNESRAALKFAKDMMK